MIHKFLMLELLAIRYGYHRAANAQFISNRLSEALLLADCGEKLRQCRFLDARRTGCWA
jgi:hypothetical protein